MPLTPEQQASLDQLNAVIMGSSLRQPTIGSGVGYKPPPVSLDGEANESVPSSVAPSKLSSVEGPQQQAARELLEAGPEERKVYAQLAKQRTDAAPGVGPFDGGSGAIGGVVKALGRAATAGIPGFEGSGSSAQATEADILKARAKDVAAGWSPSGAEKAARGIPSEAPSGVGSAPPAAGDTTPRLIGPVGGTGGVGGGGKRPTPPFDKLDASDRNTIDAIDMAKGANLSAQGARAQQALDTPEKIASGLDQQSALQDFKDKMLQDATFEVAQHSAAAEEFARQAAGKSADPDRWWNEKSTGSKIGLALAMALSEFGSHMPHVSGGGQNTTMQLIQSAIERDVSSQKDQIAGMWKAATEGRDLAKDKKAFAEFKADQIDKASLTAYKKLQIQLEGLANVADSAEKRAKLSDLYVQLQGLQGNIEKSMEGRRYDFAMAQLAAHSAGAASKHKEYMTYFDSKQKANDSAAAKAAESGQKYTPEPIMTPREFDAATTIGLQPSWLGKGGELAEGGVPQASRGEVAKEGKQAAEDKTVLDLMNDIHSTRWQPSIGADSDVNKNAQKIRALNAGIRLRIADQSARLAAQGDKEGAEHLKSLYGSLEFSDHMSDEQMALQKELVPKVLRLGQTPYKDALSGKKGPVSIPGAKDTGKVVR